MAAQTPAGTAVVALVGMPNTGKSTLFNRLTGGHAHIANWPGLTVDLLRGRLPADSEGRPFELVDLPGVHDLSGRSEDEAIVQRFLSETPPDLLLLVLNATQVASQLRLVLQMRETGLPIVLALNMSDEARRFGVRIDPGGLAQALSLPVLPVSARRHEGMAGLLAAIHQGCRPSQEEGIPGPAEGQPDDTVRRAGREHSVDGRGTDPLGPILFGADDHQLEALRLELVERFVDQPEQLLRPHSRRLDRLLLHPLVGPLLFLAIVLVMFQTIYALGTPLQELMGGLFDGLRDQLLVPLLQVLRTPPVLRDFLVDGVWLGVSTVMSFLPIIFLFYLILAIVEDSGYLPRAAFLMDGFMHWLGLDGRAFVLQVMGFGCNVPAIMGTRVIRDRGMRLLAMMVIPFALCQARLTVFVFMAAVFFPKPWWAPGLVVFGFYLMSFAAAIITGLLFKRAYPNREAFVLELPPYRKPSLHTMLRRAWREMNNFMVTTRGFIVAGAALVWLLTNLPPQVAGAGPTFASRIGSVFDPLLAPIGMTPDLTVALFFGFIAKEILLGAMAVIHHTSEAGLGAAMQASITPLQALSFMTFTLLYTPCLSTVAVQIKEAKSRMFALRSVLWSMSLAWIAALLVFQGGRLLGLAGG
ncbi:MAG: ferrous iron transport protein B [Cyanobacteria bacterium]|nr:ferrous iron transport protein B [Cyanobacteriota bacterium]